MEYFRTMYGLNEVESQMKISFLDGVQLCLERLEFFDKNAPQDFNFGVYIDKCRQLLPQLEAFIQQTTNLYDQYRSVDYKTRIIYIFNKRQIIYYL